MSVSLFPIAVFLSGAPVSVEAPSLVPVPVVIAAAPVVVNVVTSVPSGAVAAPASPMPPIDIAADAAATPPTPSADPAPVDPNTIIVTAKRRAIAADPLEGVNELSFTTVQTVDRIFVEPVSLAYKDKIPKPVRDGLRNVLDNLQEPVVFLNFLLQLKPGKAAETLGRFAVNSTIGVGGLIDVAKRRPFKLRRRVNGFAFTLGYYGVKPGAFLFLPLIGPTTVRDLLGRVIDLSLLPTAFGSPFSRSYYTVPTTAVRSMDERAEKKDELQSFEDSADPYAALRDSYLHNRQAEIDKLRGTP